ncbi:MAG: Glu-tRNA(Gln) amidotransferase subunit GatD [Candidatus Micrarchaeota archaeon]|nr:Glu-tRNA(Gln) amidotransferase subunit GatD [Candidatus Micrarchaeota archaeon]
MKYVKLRWKDKTLEGLLISEDEHYQLKLKSGYNVLIPVKEAEILEEREVEKRVPKVEMEDSGGDTTVILTGGTILSKVDYETGAVYPSEDLSEIIPYPAKIVRFPLKFSEDFSPEDWEKISKTIYQELEKNQKIIVFHGTDTMHYSASAVAFAIRAFPRPAVFVGAQRSSDRPSSDQFLNIRHAFKASTLPIGESVIVMHETISDTSTHVLRGVRARKMHTSRRDAFQPIGTGKLARIMGEKIEYIDPHLPPRELEKPLTSFSKEAGILYSYPGLSLEMLDIFLEKHKGVVIMGTGLGHLGHPNEQEKLRILKEHIEKGKIVVMTSQTIYGRINMNVYSAGRKLKEVGVLGHELDMVPETAYVKLSWILGNNLPPETYHKNLVQEVNKRSIA